MKSSRFFAYLQLMRPANIVTAMADILAGVSVAVFTDSFLSRSFFVYIFTSVPKDVVPASFLSHNLFLLLISTIGLYGGGVVFNDVFDAKLDAVERPERPIPSGRVSTRAASRLGVALLSAGVLAALMVSFLSGCIAIFIAFFALLYDKIGKHRSWGTLNMGLCRGLNLFLGSTLLSTTYLSRENREAIEAMYFIHAIICILPVVYIAAITYISRGEVHGGKKSSMAIAAGIYMLVAVLVIFFAYNTKDYSISPWNSFLSSLAFLVFFLFLIFPPLLRAYHNPTPKHIGLAVKSGVISLIALDATLAATFAGWLAGLLVLALLPVSRLLARFFAVT